MAIEQAYSKNVVDLAVLFGIDLIGMLFTIAIYALARFVHLERIIRRYGYMTYDCSDLQVRPHLYVNNCASHRLAFLFCNCGMTLSGNEKLACVLNMHC